MFTWYKLTQVQPGFVFTRHFSKLTRVEPTSGSGLDLTRVLPGLAVFIWQKLTWVGFISGWTRVSLCHVNKG